MEPIKLNDKAAKQLQNLLDTANRISEQTQTYVTALAAALDVPDGWQVDPRQMAFVAPPAPAPEQGGDDA